MAPYARSPGLFKGFSWANDRLRDAEIEVCRMAEVQIEEWHRIGEPGEPAFLNGYQNADSDATAAFYRDPSGFVHLRGLIYNPLPPPGYHSIFILPPGYGVPGDGAVTLPLVVRGAGYTDPQSLSYAIASVIGGTRSLNISFPSYAWPTWLTLDNAAFRGEDAI